jgi:hypothetical protein
MTMIEEEREHPSPMLAPSALTEADKDFLAEVMRTAVAPKLIQAVLEDDPQTVRDVLAGLERQDLWALAVVLANAAGGGS